MGASPLFSPQYDDIELAAAELGELLHHSPRLYGLKQHRWWLDGLRQVVSWLKSVSLSGVCRLLKRLHVSYKRGQAHVHSPDLDYDKKCAIVRQARDLAMQAPQEVVFLYEDELTFFSRPLVGRSYAPRGGMGSKATGGALKTRRIAACLDVRTGAVIARQRDRFNVKEMARFFGFVEKHYPDADVISIALDNWPVHFHAYVQEYLASKHSRIRLLSLPTYAPWTNPTEKVWLRLSKDILTQHRLALNWDELKAEITSWFDDLCRGSEDLLRFVGLLPECVLD